MKVILLGAPGSGKGTQAQFIAREKNIPHISTGDIFRSNIKALTPIGKVAKGYIDEGRLVPDEVVIELVRSRLGEDDARGGYLLDGFPRTTLQAEALDTFAAPDRVINIDIPLERLERRLTGRRVCSGCGASFHIDTHEDTTCSICRAPLLQRADDTPETVQKRLEVYTKETAPLILYYRDKGILIEVDGDRTIEKIADEISESLQ